MRHTPTLPLLLLFFSLAGLMLVAPVWAADLQLPPYPFWPNAAYTIDEATLLPYAEAYCQTTPDPSPVTFFLGHLPIASLDDLCQTSAALVDEQLGHLYLSGYFGGLWLRDQLTLEQGAALATRWSTPAGEWADYLIFQALAAGAARQVELAQSGTDNAVLRANRQATPTLLQLYGYNRGYLEVLLENPPEGAIPEPGTLTCAANFLECTSERVNLELLDQYAEVLPHLDAPDSWRWVYMASAVDTYGPPSAEVGRAVWEEILADRPLDPLIYQPLLDLSVGFLLVSDGVTRAAMLGWAERQPETGRCAVLLQAGLNTWAGAYFLGLASDAPAGTFPSLVCDAP